jgi:translation initiation factor 1A|tara:strand:- start:1406 stop:1921 length:516 start_codon:yes stop_codon:yes gene_type:complete
MGSVQNTSVASSEKEDKKVDSEEKVSVKEKTEKTSEKEKTEKVEEIKKNTEKKPTYSKKKKGKKSKKNQPPPDEANLRVKLPYRPKGEIFAVAETFQGGSRLQLICEDGERRMGRIPGKLRRRMWVRENDLLIVVPWSFQDSKADVKFRYTPTQTSNLKRRGKIPEILDIY